jgi:ubiquinone/menaquinone biosynthesis C-methylase UbiE
MPHQQYFDGVAHQWDKLVAGEPTRRLGEIVAALDIAPGSTVVDVGCGTGVLFPMLAERVRPPTGRIIALDVSRHMLLHARGKLANPGEAGYHLVQADAQNLALPDGMADWVIANSVFPHVHDKAFTLHEMYRVLCRGGRMVICHFNSRETVNALHRRIGGAIGDDQLPPNDEMLRMVAEAGFLDATLQDAADRYVLGAGKS